MPHVFSSLKFTLNLEKLQLVPRRMANAAVVETGLKTKASKRKRSISVISESESDCSDDFMQYLLGNVNNKDEGSPDKDESKRNTSYEEGASDDDDGDDGVSNDDSKSFDDSNIDDIFQAINSKKRKTVTGASGGENKTNHSAKEETVVSFQDPFLHRQAGRTSTYSRTTLSSRSKLSSSASNDTIDFAKIKREVLRTGAKHLDKKAAKAFKDEEILRLGGKIAKPPRMPANIGKGVAKKRAEREQKAQELAYEMGMASRKGSGKDKKHERYRNMERGLEELGDSWKGGVLKISKSDRNHLFAKKSNNSVRGGSGNRKKDNSRKFAGGGGSMKRRTLKLPKF